MDKITTTLAKIKAQSPCVGGYVKLVKSLGGVKTYGKDTSITFKQIYDSNGHDDTLWCLRATDKEYHCLWRHFAVDAAKMVEHLMEDERSHNALVVARRFADGQATEKERFAARDAAVAAAVDAAGAAAGARDAAVAAAVAAAWARDAAVAAAVDAQMDLLFEYARLGARPDNSEQFLKDAYARRVVKHGYMKAKNNA